MAEATAGRDREHEERFNQINRLLQAIEPAWPTLLAELQRRREEHVAKLVAKNDQAMRGRIWELDDIIGLPLALARERQQIESGARQEPIAQASLLDDEGGAGVLDE